MLQLLHIENIAVIEEADITFDEGFNALTGETGADRLNAIRAYSDDLTIYVDPVGRQVRIIKAN